MIDYKVLFDSVGMLAFNQIERTRKKFPAKFFMPNKPQAELIRAVGSLTPEKRVYLVTSANGIGKTTVAINIVLNIIYGKVNIYPWAQDCETGEVYPEGFFGWPLFQQWPYGWPTSIWYISNRDALMSIEKKFLEWIAPEDYLPFKDGKTHISRMRFRSKPEWEIQFKTIEQDPNTFESADISVVIFDEPPPYELYTAAVGRLRSGGIIIIPATPLFTAAWFVNEIINKMSDGDKYHQTVNIWTNCIEKAGFWNLGTYGKHPKGNLTQNNIEFLLKNWSIDEIEARRDGTFKYLIGLVFKTYSDYDRRASYLTSVLANPNQYMYRMTIDPHDRRPPAIIWELFDRHHNRHVLREWPNPKLDREFQGMPYHKIKNTDPYTIEDFVKIIDRIERSMRIPPSRLRRIMDPNFGRKPNRSTGRTIAEDYIAAARRVLNQEWAFNLSANDNMIAGHEKVREYLKPNAHGELRFTMEPDIFNLDYSFRNYSWDTLTPAQQEKKELSIKVRELGKDFIDCLRYSMMIPLTFEEMNPQRDPYEGEDYGDWKESPELKTRMNWRDRLVERPKGASGA